MSGGTHGRLAPLDGWHHWWMGHRTGGGTLSDHPAGVVVEMRGGAIVVRGWCPHSRGSSRRKPPENASGRTAESPGMARPVEIPSAPLVAALVVMTIGTGCSTGSNHPIGVVVKILGGAIVVADG